jgi:hypothetical protein
MLVEVVTAAFGGKGSVPGVHQVIVGYAGATHFDMMGYGSIHSRAGSLYTLQLRSCFSDDLCCLVSRHRAGTAGVDCTLVDFERELGALWSDTEPLFTAGGRSNSSSGRLAVTPSNYAHEYNDQDDIPHMAQISECAVELAPNICVWAHAISISMKPTSYRPILPFQSLAPKLESPVSLQHNGLLSDLDFFFLFGFPFNVQSG